MGITVDFGSPFSLATVTASLIGRHGLLCKETEMELKIFSDMERELNDECRKNEERKGSRDESRDI